MKISYAINWLLNKIQTLTQDRKPATFQLHIFMAVLAAARLGMAAAEPFSTDSDFDFVSPLPAAFRETPSHKNNCSSLLNNSFL